MLNNKKENERSWFLKKNLYSQNSKYGLPSFEQIENFIFPGEK